MAFFRFAELSAYSLFRIVPYLFLFLYIFKGRLRFPKWATYTVAVALSALRCLCGYEAYFNIENLTNPNPGILIFIALGILLVKDHFGKSLFFVWMLANISGFIVTASKWLEGKLFGDMALQLHRWTNLITLVLVETAVLIPLFFYIKHIYSKATREYSSNRLWNLLWLVPFTLYAVWYRNSFFSSESPDALALSNWYASFCLLIAVGGMLIYTMVAFLINEYAENIRLREKEYLISLQQTQYENLKDRIEEARAAKHDFRQHLHIISAYLKDEKYDRLNEYINSFHQSIPENAGFVFCEHYAVNALLQYFSGMAKQNEIKFSSQVVLPKDISISDDALTVLLGNLLENAVHACQAEKEAEITVKGMIDDNGVFFKILNTFTGKIKTASDGLYISTKHEGTGIGLRSVKNIVNNHNGIMEISHKNGLFVVSVLLNTQD